MDQTLMIILGHPARPPSCLAGLPLPDARLSFGQVRAGKVFLAGTGFPSRYSTGMTDSLRTTIIKQVLISPSIKVKRLRLRLVVLPSNYQLCQYGSWGRVR